MAKKLALPLDKALRKVSPDLEKAVKQALKRAWAFGIVIGMLVGILSATAVIAWNASPKMVKNAQPCDLFAFGPVRPDLPDAAPQVCWTRVDVPDYNGEPATVFVCPTKYNLQIQLVVGDVNADTVQRLYDACLSARELLDQQVVPVEVSAEVNG